MKAAVQSFVVMLTIAICPSARADWNSTIAASNPLNWYRFDELSGTTAIDYGSEHRNGTYGTGALDATRGVPGLVGTAAQFGNQSTVFLSAPDLTGDWSAEFLVERTGTKSSSVLIRGIPFAFPSGALKLEQYPGTEQIGYTKYGIVDATFSPGASAPLNQWVDIIYVNQAAADRVSLFVNGVLVGTRIDHFSLSRDQIGSWSDTVPESPLAIMDEAIIYSRALSPGEVASHFAAIPEPTAIACVGIAAIVMPLRCRFRRFNDGGNCNAINCAERWHALR